MLLQQRGDGGDARGGFSSSPLPPSHGCCSSGLGGLLKAAEGESPSPAVPALAGGSRVLIRLHYFYYPIGLPTRN